MDTRRIKRVSVNLLKFLEIWLNSNSIFSVLSAGIFMRQSLKAVGTSAMLVSLGWWSAAVLWAQNVAAPKMTLGNTQVAIAQSAIAATPTNELPPAATSAATSATTSAATASDSTLPEPFPTLNSPQFDRQLELYLRYLAENGRPDVLIVGSSRAFQGIDPVVLQAELAKAGYPNRKVFNFGINGATAQVVAILLQRVLLPSQMPQVIIWGDGSRAFNSGRRDRTYDKIITSPGFERLETGQRPILVPYEAGESDRMLDPRQVWGLNIVSDTFVPETYFQRFSKIAGQFDGDYNKFDLQGEQTKAMEALLNQTRQQKVPVVFVNLPLTDIYLDQVRQRHERQFRKYHQRLADLGYITFFDLGSQWLDRYDLFADPSHLNQKGAAAVAADLGQRLSIYFERRLRLPKQNLHDTVGE
jgi:hypothetical protein